LSSLSLLAVAVVFAGAWLRAGVSGGGASIGSGLGCAESRSDPIEPDPGG
jgi:hypothetical protein